MSRATYFHAGCPACIAAEEQLVDALDTTSVSLERVHLGNDPARVREATDLGVKSVPALVLDGNVFHINFGAALSDLG